MLSKTLVVPFLLSLLDLSSSKRDSVTYCGACLGLIEEMNWAVASTDPKKKVQIGSFRIDPQGKQDLREIPLARSEVHLTELLETICNHMHSYASSVDSTGNTNFFRSSSRDGTPISLKKANVDQNTQKMLKFACEAIVEDFEDDLIELYQEGEEDGLSERMCADRAGYCAKANVTEQMFAYGQAVMAGMLESMGLGEDGEDKQADSFPQDIFQTGFSDGWAEGWADDIPFPDDDEMEDDLDDDDEGPAAAVGKEPVRLDEDNSVIRSEL